MAMTPLQSVLWDVKQRIENDKKLSKLRQKVNSGKATYADTAAYSTHVGNLLGDTFAQHILSVSPELREALTVELLHDRYMDINAIIDRVQKSMDEAQGLHLAPQHAPFYDDRAHQIGSALADPTVPDETIKRRARAATATATKSMHDDRMKTEAKFRSRAGLKCTVNRVAAAKCCEWCDQVAGKYAYEDTPPDLWRRHDNCNCTIVYGTRRDRQVLRGTEKKWEIVAEGAGAPEPVRLTPEQARKLQEKHQLTVLTKPAESGTIETRNMANGMRRSPMIPLTDADKKHLQEEIVAIGADPAVFVFRDGSGSGYSDRRDIIFVSSNVFPSSDDSIHPRDRMSERAVLAHEYYGHRAHRGTSLPQGSWNDEFRASYSAAKNCPNLTDEDRRYLVLDAIERAREAGVSITYNDFMRRVLYG